ncbi:MAG TPA: helix-hairpin-helix domain-containing protein [Longimicrobiales bacterium]|nr:helix-hairpin-helix domain-containing protein [Longimicrobiales bacterium]
MKALQVIPGVGKRVSQDLWNLGIRAVADLEDADPDELYARLCTLEQGTVDRCMLYTFRCAVYFASSDEHDPELLKWWKWKDRESA